MIDRVAQRCSGGGPICGPASMTMSGWRGPEAAVASRSDCRSDSGAAPAPLCKSSRFDETSTLRRQRDASVACADANHSDRPGPLGADAPRAALASPPRSMSTVGVDRAESSAMAAATTVVPLPPFGDQKSVYTPNPQEIERSVDRGKGERPYLCSRLTTTWGRPARDDATRTPMRRRWVGRHISVVSYR